MNTDPTDEFLATENEGQLSKIEAEPQDGSYKKDDELPRLTDIANTTAPPPMDHRVVEVSDDGDMLAEAAEQAAGSKKYRD